MEHSKRILIEPPKEFKIENTWQIWEQNDSKFKEGPSRFVVEEKATLGSGGTSKIYKGWDRYEGKFVAVKVLDNIFSRPEYRTAFEQEAKGMMELNHPGIPEVHMFGIARGPKKDKRVVIVMELIDGRQLSDRLREKPPLSIDEVIEITKQITSVIKYANDQNKFHGDISTRNTLLSEGHLKVIDWGSATFVDKDNEYTVGTSSPERITGTRDTRTEEYALAVTLYEVLFSRTPDFNLSAENILASLKSQQKYDFAEEDMKKLAGVLAKGLAYEPQKRYQNVTEFSESFCGVFKNGQLKTLQT